MGQVPLKNFHYLVVGDGRTSSHLQIYFQRLGISFSTFARSRNSAAEWAAATARATHVLLLIKDDQIDVFFRARPELKTKCCVHFSGALVHPEIPSAHPLMTFTHLPLPDELLDQMVFTIEQEGPAFAELLPGVPNAHVRVPRAQKARYHAWCVISGNFTTLLWEATAREFANGLGLDPQILVPYFTAQARNISAHLSSHQSSPESATTSCLTGPFARRDLQTIEKHEAALSGHPFQSVYSAFWQAYQSQQGIQS
jgi:hypothetical protein